MKVSVIVPVCNTSKYLRQCLQSLREQTLREIEIICVNDGSTDNSAEIIDQFAAEDSRFRVFHKVNTGYGHSVNIGIRAVRSPYFAIVESDDFAQRDMLQNLYDAAERNQVDFVKGNYNAYCEKTMPAAEFEEMLGSFPYGQVISPEEDPRVFGVHPSVWASLYRKSFQEENDIWFHETPGASYQDIGFAFKANACARKICFIKPAVLNYRVDNTDSSVHNPHKIFCVCDELHEIERFIARRAEAGAFHEVWLRQVKQIAAWIKFRNYLWNYTRLSLPYQYAFLINVQQELKAVREQNCEIDIWNDDEKIMLARMTDDPNLYFQLTGKGYEDSRISMLPGVLNLSFSVKCFNELVTESRDIYIYGAGRMGRRVWSFLKKRGDGHKVRGFIVSKPDNNPDMIEDKPVRLFPAMQKQEHKSALVIVSLDKQYQYEIASKLQEGGYERILLLDEKIRKLIYENSVAI